MNNNLRLEPLLDLEQYFWKPETIEKIASVVTKFKRIACLSAPTLGIVLPEQSVILDIDDRLSRIAKNFRHWDIKNPTPIQEEFDVIVSDPPFSLVSGEEFRKAVDVLGNAETKLIVVDSTDGRLFVPAFPKKNLKRMFEAKYYTEEEHPELWYFWGDI